MLKASPEKYVQLGLFRPVGKGVLKFTSPALADGRLYLRLQDGSVACHDLTEAGNK